MPNRADIGPDFVQRLIESQFPQWAHLPVTSMEPGGWDNRSFRLGDTMVVRLPSAACYSLQVEKEQRWLPIFAGKLSVPVPMPRALGRPGEGYLWRWSIYGWLEGEAAARRIIGDPLQFARSVAHFLAALQRTDATEGPLPGEHNFHRGGLLEHYDQETRDAIGRLRDRIDAPKVLRVWEAALASRWRQPPVWIHGDMSSGNLLVRDGSLSGVIDFGCCAVGDPACDLVLAWTFFGPRERAAFRAGLPLDAETWLRGRGWAIWKALISLARAGSSGGSHQPCFTLEQILQDYDATDGRY